jgi:hypothetical protein
MTLLYLEPGKARRGNKSFAEKGSGAFRGAHLSHSKFLIRRWAGQHRVLETVVRKLAKLGGPVWHIPNVSVSKAAMNHQKPFVIDNRLHLVIGQICGFQGRLDRDYWRRCPDARIKSDGFRGTRKFWKARNERAFNNRNEVDTYVQVQRRRLSNVLDIEFVCPCLMSLGSGGTIFTRVIHALTAAMAASAFFFAAMAACFVSLSVFCIAHH